MMRQQTGVREHFSLRQYGLTKEPSFVASFDWRQIRTLVRQEAGAIQPVQVRPR